MQVLEPMILEVLNSGRDKAIIVEKIDRLLNLYCGVTSLNFQQTVAEIIAAQKYSPYSSSCDIDSQGSQILFEALLKYPRFVELVMSGDEMGTAGATALAKFLTHNAILQRLVLDKNHKAIIPKRNILFDADFQLIANSLQDNFALKILEITSSMLSAGSAHVFANAIARHPNLYTLKLVGHTIGVAGACAFGDALKINKSLRNLILNGSDVGVEGAKALSEGLEQNTTLEHFYLSGNVGTDGARFLSQALMINQTLRELILANTGMGDQGAKALGCMLSINHTLKLFSIMTDDLGFEGQFAITRSLFFNVGLHTLQLDNVPMSFHAMDMLGRALQNNTSLKALRISQNQLTNYDVQFFATMLRKNRGLTCIDVSQQAEQLNEAAMSQLQKTAQSNNQVNRNCSENQLSEPEEKEPIKNLRQQNVRIEGVILTLLNSGLPNTTIIPKIQHMLALLGETSELDFVDPFKYIGDIRMNFFGELGPETAVNLFAALQANLLLKKLAIFGGDLDKLGSRALARYLMQTNCLEKFCFKYNNFNDHPKPDVQIILDALNIKLGLVEFELHAGSLDADDVAVLSDVLKNQSSLRCFKLHNSNSLSAVTLPIIARLLKTNTTLTHLELEEHIQPSTAEILADSLESNKTLRYLKLHSPAEGIGTQGAEVLAESLLQNSSLRELVLVNNKIGNKGAIAFANVLQHNCGIKALSFHAEDIHLPGIKAIAKMLQTSKALRKLTLGIEFDYKEIACLAKGLSCSSALHTLELKSFLSDKKMNELFRNLNNNLRLTDISLGNRYHYSDEKNETIQKKISVIIARNKKNLTLVLAYYVLMIIENRFPGETVDHARKVAFPKDLIVKILCGVGAMPEQLDIRTSQHNLERYTTNILTFYRNRANENKPMRLELHNEAKRLKR